MNIVIVMLCRFSRYQHLQLASKRDLEVQLTLSWGGGGRDRTEARVHNDFMKLVNDVCHIEPIMDSFDRFGGHEWHFVGSKETQWYKRTI